MQIPITIFLLLYLMMVTFFVLFSIFLLYHAVRFGVASRANMVSITVYLIFTFGLLLVSYFYILKVDWSQSLTIF